MKRLVMIIMVVTLALTGCKGRGQESQSGKTDTATVLSGPVFYGNTGIIGYIIFLKKNLYHARIFTEGLRRPLVVGEEIQVQTDDSNGEVWTMVPEPRVTKIP